MLLPAPVELPCAQGRARRRSATAPPRSFDLSAQVRPGGRAHPASACSCSAAATPAHPPAGATTSCDRRLDRPTTIHIGRRPHAPPRALDPGRAQPRHAARAVLLDIPRWDFHWQSAYLLARPSQPQPGDVLRVTCRHDVTLRMQATPTAVRNAALRPLGRGDDGRDVPRHRPGHARLRRALGARAHPPRLADVSRARRHPTWASFVAAFERELAARGHELAHAVVDRRGGRRATSRLLRDIVAASRGVPAGRRVRALPRACRPRRARRDGRRSSLTAHGQDVENARTKRAVRARRVSPSAARTLWSPSPAGCATGSWRRCPEARGQDDGRRLRRRRRALRALRRAEGAPRRLAAATAQRSSASARSQRAQERAPARAGVRAPGRGRARVRRRRAAAAGARGPPGHPPQSAPSPHEQVATWLAAARRASASRASSSRSAWRRSRAWPQRVRRRDERRRARRSSSRRRQACSSIRRGRRWRSQRRSTTAAALPRPNEAGAAGGAGARRQASGGAGGGVARPSRSRSASLISTSGRTASSIPASRATASACS